MPGPGGYMGDMPKEYFTKNNDIEEKIKKLEKEIQEKQKQLEILRATQN